MSGRAVTLAEMPAASSGSSSSSSSSSSSRSSSPGSEREESCGFVRRLQSWLYLVMGLDFQSAQALQVSKDAQSPVARALTADNSGKKVEDCYELDRKDVLGEGGYASVVVAKEKLSGQSRAVKCVMKSRVASTARLRQEVDIMLLLDHPNVLRLFETFEDRRFVYLVLELCAGGDLFDRVAGEGRFSEPKAARVMQQIFRAVAHMHKVGVCHRDLKPENFFFRDEGPVDGNEVKVGDFGIAAMADGRGHATMSTKTGTPQYVAPEVLAHNPSYTDKCDCWSCGVLLYLLLSKRLPFQGRDDASTLRSVLLGQLSFPSSAFEGVSRDAKRLIRRLMARDPHSRISAEQALRDPWLQARVPRGDSPKDGLRRSLPEINCFRTSGHLKKAALRLVARHVDSRRLQHLCTTFSQLDADESGTVAMDELAQGLAEAGVPREHHDGVMQALDGDGSGQVDYSEFLAATMERRLYLEESACWAAFRIFDRNDDGRISNKEMAEVLSSPHMNDAFKEEDVAEAFRDADLNSDGYIDFEEFMAMLRKP